MGICFVTHEGSGLVLACVVQMRIAADDTMGQVLYFQDMAAFED